MAADSRKRDGTYDFSSPGGSEAFPTFAEDADDIKFTYTDSTYQFPKVKAASVDKLIERLTHEVYPGKPFCRLDFSLKELLI